MLYSFPMDPNTQMHNEILYLATNSCGSLVSMPTALPKWMPGWIPNTLDLIESFDPYMPARETHLTSYTERYFSR